MSTTTASTDESIRQQRRRERNSARPFHAAPIVELDDEDGDQTEKPSKMRGFLRAIGLGCLVSGGNNRDRGRRHTISERLSRLTRREADGPALRAITIEDARYAFNQNVLDSEDGSVYSSYYDGHRGVGGNQQYVLFLGTEVNSNIKPKQSQHRSQGEPEIVELKSLRPSLQERQLPVFFTPPPPDIVASVTPRRRAQMNYVVSPPGSPIGGFA